MSVQTHELRVAMTVEDFEAAVAFFTDALGLKLAAEWDQPRGRGGIFAIERATLELLDGEMAGGVDDFEVGRRVSGPVRLAIGVTDVEASVAAATGAGAILEGAPRAAPWGDEVARVRTPQDMQLTLFTSRAD